MLFVLQNFQEDVSQDYLYSLVLVKLKKKLLKKCNLRKEHTWRKSPYSVNLRIQSEYRKIRTRKIFILGHFVRSGSKHWNTVYLFTNEYKKTIIFNTFHVTSLFLYSLKTSENLAENLAEQINGLVSIW